jgi:neutral ceramidase
MGVMRLVLTFLVAALSLATAADFRAGVSKIDITPQGPIWLSGYANRTHASTGVAHPLFAKALALDDGRGGRVVIVTTDLIGLPRAITDVVAARALKDYGLDRRQLLFNSSHTHTGPVVRPNLTTMFDLGPEDQKRLEDYSRKLTEDLATVIGGALGNLAPAKLSVGHGSAGFAINRRQFNPKGVAIGVNPQGPVDHDVPVLQVTGPDGTLQAVLFGYACHNTTMTGEFYEVSGDYAGYAQSAFESSHPGATAMFLMLCGGDQNPNPRSKPELAREHGQSLAAELTRVLGGAMKPVRPPIRSTYQVIELDFAHHSREMFEEERNGSNKFKARRAAAMLAAYDERHPLRRTPYPVQAIRFGQELTLVALGGEVVVDYALRAKKEFPKQDLIVAGYSNDVMCYIPSQRVLKEGGYEAVDSMIYYGQPGPFADDVEERIFTAIHQSMKRVGVK